MLSRQPTHDATSEAARIAAAAGLRERLPGVPAWYGIATRRWWAMVSYGSSVRLVEAATPEELTAAIAPYRAPRSTRVSFDRPRHPVPKPYTRSYLATPLSVGHARRAAEQVVRAWGVEESQTDDVGLVISELCTNACEACPDAEFHLRLTPLSDAVQIEVWDPSPALPQRRKPGPTDPTGRGLGIIEALACDYGTRPHKTGKTVYAVIPTGPLVPQGQKEGPRRSGRWTTNASS